MQHSGNSTVRRILTDVNRTDGIYYRFAKRIGIKENALGLFYALSDGKPHSQKEICDEWMIPRSTLNTIVKEYAENGYIRLEKGVRAKEKILLITEKGRKYTSAWMDRLFSAEQEAFTKVVDRYGGAFVDALSLFVDTLEEQLLQEKGNGEHDDAE